MIEQDLQELLVCVYVSVCVCVCVCVLEKGVRNKIVMFIHIYLYVPTSTYHVRVVAGTSTVYAPWNHGLPTAVIDDKYEAHDIGDKIKN